MKELSKESNQVLVLLPGMGCNDQLWQSLLPYLPKNLKLVMPDMSSLNNLEEMLSRIEEIQHQKFILLGFSMGGYLAQEFYIRYSHRISQLIIICSTGNGYTPYQRENILDLIDKFRNGLLDPLSASYLSRFVDPKSTRHQQALDITYTMLQQTGTEGICRQMEMTLNRENSNLRFQKTDIPKLVIGAKYDKVIPTSHIQNLSDALDAKVEWIDCGHMAPLEEPAHLGNLLTSWFSSVALL